MSRYPYEKVEEDCGNRVRIDDKTVKTICNNIQIEALIEVIPSASINIVEATEIQGQPMAQIEQREIRKSQREDEVLGKWVRAVMDKKFPKEYDYSKEDQTMRKTFHSLRMIRGILYREVKEGDNVIQQLVLPKVYRHTVLQALHNDVGHPGRDRTISLIRERFYWPRMTAEIEKWTSECRRCLLRKSPTNNLAPLVNIITTYPLELVCMDYLTLEPAKGVGNVLVITDHFTKYALAIATKNQTAKTTAEAFHEHFITHYGIPTRIHSDQGATFESEIVKELCKITGMTKSRTTPYHPMGNPIPERFNRTLLDMLGTLEPSKKTDWKRYLPSLTYAYNCTRHETTKISPHELMFGRKPRLPIDSMFDTPVQQQANQTTRQYIEGLKQRMKTAQDIASKVTEAARIKMKTCYDKKAKAARICIGDKVLVKILKFDGKHKIEDKYEDQIYTVVGQPDKKIPVFNVKGEDETEKILHRNHLFLLGFMDSGATETEKGATDVKNDHGQEKETEVKATAVEKDIVIDEGSEKVEAIEDDSSDEDDDSVTEFVSHTYTTGDAWKTASHSPHHSKGPVLGDPEEKKNEAEPIVEDKDKVEPVVAEKEEKIVVSKEIEEEVATLDEGLPIAEEKDDGTAVVMLDEIETGIGTDLGAFGGQKKLGATVKEIGLGTRPKEKIIETAATELKDKKKGKIGRKMDTVKTTDPVTIEVTDDDLHTVEVIEADKEAEEPDSTEVIPEAKGADRGLRRSQRDRKVPQRLGLYYTHQITNRPVDRRLQTLQTLIGSGILNELDSDMTNSILDAVIK